MRGLESRERRHQRVRRIRVIGACGGGIDSTDPSTDSVLPKQIIEK